MKKKEIKKETFLNEALIIEKEINFLSIEKLWEKLENECKYLIIIMHNVNKGSFANAYEFNRILHSTDRKIIFICSGEINLTGIIPLLANHKSSVIALRNTKFNVHAANYKKQFVEPEYQQEFKDIFKELMFNKTAFSLIEIISLINHGRVFTAEESYEYEIVDDILDNENYTYDTEKMNKIVHDVELYERRVERVKQKCEGRLSYIPICIN